MRLIHHVLAVTSIPATMLLAANLAAAPIPGLYSTGVNDAGALLEPGEIDPHYTITASADPEAGPGPEAYTLQPGYPVGPWFEEGPNSRWIAPQADQNQGDDGAGENEPGTYTYQTSFDLTGLDPATAEISGLIGTDDSLVAVRLNGTALTGIASSGFTTLNEFAIPRGSVFVDGENILEFDISNGGAARNPTGFRVEMSGRATGSNEAPGIFGQPQSQIVIVGDSVSFTVDAGGTPPLAYEWQFNGIVQPGADSGTYTLTSVTTNNSGDFTVVVMNAFGSVTSAVARLTVWEPFPGIFNTGVNEDRALLADEAIDPHYRLILNAENPESTEVIAQSVIPSPPWLTNSDKSRWVGPLADANANAGDYTYQLQLNLTGYDPATAILAGSWATDDGGSLYLNGADTGFRSPSFTAFSEFTLTNGFVSGANILEFRIVNGGINPTGLRVENLRGTAEQGGVSETAPRIVTQPAGSRRVLTEDFTLTVVADGAQPLSYQWFHNNAPIDGETTPSLNLPLLLTSDAGNYHVQVSNSLGSVESDMARIDVHVPQVGAFNTGVDAGGAPLAIGEIDPHYVLLSGPDTAYPGPTNYVTAGPIPPWFENDDDSQWIAPRPDSSATLAPGSYSYRLIFVIDDPAEVATAELSANVGTDDGNAGVFLNGTQILDFPAGTGFGGLTPLFLPAGSPFVQGYNTLDFVVVNGGSDPNPSGLRVDDLVLSGVTVVQRPEIAISRTENAVRLTWPAAITDFVLEETGSLPGGWTASSASVQTEGNNSVATIAIGNTPAFFRLRK
jgi:hypothetical protein